MHRMGLVWICSLHGIAWWAELWDNMMQMLLRYTADSYNGVRHHRKSIDMRKHCSILSILPHRRLGIVYEAVSVAAPCCPGFAIAGRATMFESLFWLWLTFAGVETRSLTVTETTEPPTAPQRSLGAQR